MLPVLDDVPVDPYRSRLYTADELYDTPSYERSYDARAYAWSQQPGRPGRHARPDPARPRDRRRARGLGVDAPPGRRDGRARRLPRPTTRTLDGGPARATGSARTLTVATGGGPGAMEAVNLGARLAGEGAEAVDEAVHLLAKAPPSFRPSVDAWLAPARDGPRRRLRARATPSASRPGTTATSRATCSPPRSPSTSRNPTREAILLEVCDAGIVFLPGAAGTVQEVFQDACENYYADETSVAPMVLVGRTYWTRRCRRGRCCRRWPAAGPWRIMCTSWTPSRRPRRCDGRDDGLMDGAYGG